MGIYVGIYRYINERRLYYVAQDLINTEDSISEIASRYYSEQSALTRAMKTFFNCTPDRVRKGIDVIPDNKQYLADFIDQSTDEEIANIAKSIDDGSYFYTEEFAKEMEIYELSQEYGIDVDTLYLISDLAYKLDIPFGQLAEDCLFYMDKQSGHDDCPLSPSQLHAVECGIHSDEELEKICDYFNCKWYDLDPRMVDIYYYGPDIYEYQKHFYYIISKTTFCHELSLPIHLFSLLFPGNNRFHYQCLDRQWDPSQTS